jgi:repressor LexA
MRIGMIDDPGPEGDGLTPVRRKIVRVIEESMRSKGYSPSMREIGDAVGLASTSSVSHQLSVLQAKGYLIREAGRPRAMTLRLPGQDGAAAEAGKLPVGVTGVPLVGRIAAGTPVLADELLEDVVPLPMMLVGNGDGLIMLRVAGDSMIGAAIADGDWVVVHRQPDAESGDIVAAMLESEGSADGEATVKTLKKADGHAWLIPHNPAYLPIMADCAVIIGKVVNVLRRLLARAPARRHHTS